MSKPVLIVTCRTGSEKWCVEEIGNVIFPLDPSVEIVETKYSGLIIVYSNLDQRTIYERVLKSEYGFVENIIPVDICGSFTMDFLNRVAELVSSNERVKLKLRIRGRRGLSRVVWKKIIDIFAGKNVLHDKSSNICIFVEVIDDQVFMGRGFC